MAGLSSHHLSPIARPYARAAFDYAREKQHLPMWKTFLESATDVAENAAVVRLLNHPDITSTMAFDFFRDVLSSLLDDERKNFLHLLAEHKRLNVLPEIAESFQSYCAALEKISTVRVLTAVALQETYQKKLSTVLSKRFQRDIHLQCDIDPALLGGAILYIDDQVIDASIRGKLTRLLEFSLR